MLAYGGMRKSFGFVSTICLIGFVSQFAQARDRWTELNIGPFYVATDSDTAAAREALTQLEQLRWVLGGLLESKDLPSLWPIHILLTNNFEKTNPIAANRQFVWQNAPSVRLFRSPAGFVSQNGSVPQPGSDQFVWQNGIYVLVCAPGARLPLSEVAGLLLDANTPRLPPDVESGLRQLFGTLSAKGSRVTWGGPPAHPDLAWARMQLFATKFEYTSSFHIFLTALKGGSTLRAAEQNAFGKDSAALEQEAAANLASHNWQPVSVSGRPLDPKRDLGEHSLDEALVGVYLADAQLASDPKRAEAAYKSAIEAGGTTAALGFEGLAQVAKIDKDDPDPYLEKAIHAGSRSAPVYVAYAEDRPPEQALPLLKKAAQLNPLWAEPVFRQVEFTSDPAEKVALLKKATQLDPRATRYWIELAQLQTTQGESTAAQGSWLRAEDSAPADSERDRVHQLRMASEQERLDAAADARRRDREAVHLADEKAQQSEEDRIHAAEQKANNSNDAAAGGEKPETVVPWSQLVPQKKLEGTLIKVDCLGSNGRLFVKDRSGRTIQLLLKNASDAGMACGVQKPARRISLTYAAEPDDRFNTAGNVTSINFP